MIADRVWYHIRHSFTWMCLTCFCLCLPTALYSIHKKKVYGAKMLESQNLQTPKSKYVMTHEKKKKLHCFCDLAKQFSIDPTAFWRKTSMPDEFFCVTGLEKLLPRIVPWRHILLLQSFHHIGAAPHEQPREPELQARRPSRRLPWQPRGPGNGSHRQTGGRSACQSDRQSGVPGGEEHRPGWVTLIAAARYGKESVCSTGVKPERMLKLEHEHKTWLMGLCPDCFCVLLVILICRGEAPSHIHTGMILPVEGWVTLYNPLSNVKKCMFFFVNKAKEKFSFILLVVVYFVLFILIFLTYQFQC